MLSNWQGVTVSITVSLIWIRIFCITYANRSGRRRRRRRSRPPGRVVTFQEINFRTANGRDARTTELFSLLSGMRSVGWSENLRATRANKMYHLFNLGQVSCSVERKHSFHLLLLPLPSSSFYSLLVTPHAIQLPCANLCWEESSCSICGQSEKLQFLWRHVSLAPYCHSCCLPHEVPPRGSSSVAFP